MRTILKWMAFILSILLFIQSCTIYRSKTSTLHEVILAEKKVRMVSNNFEKYKFDYLFAENDTVYGITSSKQTIKLLSENIVKFNILGGSSSLIKIPTDQIKEYQLKNSTLTTVVNIGIPVFSLLIIVSFSFMNETKDAIIDAI